MKSLQELIVICEQNSVSLTQSVSDTLPATYVIPQLKNNDFYTQYRYGLALAAASAASTDPSFDFKQTSAFGEQLTMVSYTPEEQRIIELAAKLMGVSAKLISTPTSQEPTDTQKNSPTPKQK